MEFERQTSRALHDEHLATIALLNRVEQTLGRRGGADGPAAGTAARDLAAFLEHELPRHFDFEERELFPRLAASGEENVAALLGEEHATIRAVTAELLPLLAGAAGGPLPPAAAELLRRDAREIVERLGAHIQKETMALLPLLDDLLDADVDRELAFAYAAQ
jgi:hemerythrin-like domain-containing protein